MKAVSRLTPVFLGASVPLVTYPIIERLWPTPWGLSLSFWLLWALVMGVALLPMLFLEAALAKRVRTLPLKGFEELTRQADAPRAFRISSWLGFCALLLFVVGLFKISSVYAEELLKGRFEHADLLSTTGFLALYTIGMVWLSRFRFAAFVPMLLLVALAAVASSGVNVQADWNLGEFNAQVLSKAALLALVGSLVGCNLYWQLALPSVKRLNEPVAVALPAWAAALVSGAVYALFGGVEGQLSQVLQVVAMAMLALTLTDFLSRQFLQRLKSPFHAVLALALALMFWSLPVSIPVLFKAVIGAMLVAALVHVVFAGWFMRISHLRKALSFDSEVGYNLWRVLMRFVAPLSLLAALAGLMS